ncbi:unnamed protein product [Auanema sp. JU1783]|nr:unnamed protein product [Auanema sp. JU1783]
MPIKMMTAARSSAFHYKKRTSNSKSSKVKGKSSKDHAVSPSPSKCTVKTQVSGNSLTVPNGGVPRKRSGSVPSLKVNTLANVWNLKHEHIRALKMTWQRLCEPPGSQCHDITKLVTKVFDKLDTKDNTIKSMFYKSAFVDSMQERCEKRVSKSKTATVHDHVHFLVSLISQVIQNLQSDPQEMFEHLDMIGRKHLAYRQYGFQSAHWEKVGQYFVDIVVIQDCVRGFPEACRAWTIMIAAMIDRLRAAPRRGSTTSSTNNLYNIQENGLRRGSATSLFGRGSQSSLSSCGSHVRVSCHHASTSDLLRSEEKEKESFRTHCPRSGPSTSCIDLTPLGANLPDVRTSHPARA